MSAPRLIQVLSLSKQHNVEFHEDGFSQILLQEDIKNRSVAIISVAGLLNDENSISNYFLRYLYAQYRKKDVTNWIEERIDNEDQRKTAGIMMWSDIFTYNYETGERIAIILLNTQNYGDNFHNDGKNSSIFVLSTLIASIQCCTLAESALKKESEWLKTLLQYGEVFNASSKEKPLQKLVIIIPNSGEYKQSSSDNEMLQEILESSVDKVSIEQKLESCFSDISCYTLPSYDLSSMNFEIISNLEDLIPRILSPKNIVVKTLNGNTIQAQYFPLIIKSYMSLFGENKTLDPSSIFPASADASNMLAIVEATEAYSFVMGIHVKNSNYENLKICHLDTYDRDVIPTFHEYKKLGGSELSKKYLHKLDQEINAEYSRFVTQVVTRGASFTEKCIHARRLAKTRYVDAMEKAVSNGPITEDVFKMKHVFAEKKAKQLFKDHCGIEEFSGFERGPFIKEYFEHVQELEELIEKEQLEIKQVSIKT